MVSAPLATSFFHTWAGNLGRMSDLTWNSTRIFTTYTPPDVPTYNEVKELLQMCLWGRRAISRRGWHMTAPSDFNPLGFFSVSMQQNVVLSCFQSCQMIPNEGRGSLTPTKQNKEQGRKNTVRRKMRQDWNEEGGLEEWEGSWWVGMVKI